MLQLVDEIELLDTDKEDLERLVAEIEQADYAELLNQTLSAF